MSGNTFTKQERLCGASQVDRLFSEGNRQISVYPIRLVWLLSDEPDDTAVVRLLISAPKRRFHHAVDRNRIKRQIREFYRTSSGPLKDVVASKCRSLSLAILFTADELWSTARLTPRLKAATDQLTAVLSETDK